MLKRFIPSLVIAFVAATAPASAATLTSFGSIVYTAGAGETNSLVISSSGANYVFTDASGITIMPTAPCTAAANVGTCPAAGVSSLSASLGNLNDTASVAASVGLPVTNLSLNGQDGNDTLTGSDSVTSSLSGDDSPGAGNDVLTAGAAGGSLDGGDGNDTLTGGPGRDQISDGPGSDTAVGGADYDTFSVSDTADGADTFDGGPDFDYMSWADRTEGVSVSLDGIANDGAGCVSGTCEGDNVTGIEQVDATDGDDVLVGSAADESLDADDGNDSVSGGPGDDDVDGGIGNDDLHGDGGNDYVYGSEGDDVQDGGAGDDDIYPGYYDVGVDTYVGGDGLDTMLGTSAQNSLQLSADGLANDGFVVPIEQSVLDNIGADVENLNGSDGADVISGNDAANVVNGQGGADTIITGAGSDTADGGAGNDTIDAGAGSDTLIGAEGTDLLRSRDAFADQVDCGSSADSVIGDSLDQPESSCESFTDGITIAKSAKASEKKIKLELGCPPAEGAPCAVKVKLRAKGKTIATAKQTLAAGASQSVALRLSDDGAAVLRGPGRVHAQASATFTDAQGQLVTTKQEVLVR